MKYFSGKILTAALCAALFPAVQAQQALDSTPSVTDLTQTTKLAEKKAQVVVADKITTNKELSDLANKIINDRKVRYLVYKDAEIVDELIKVYARIDTASKEADGMIRTCLDRMFDYAIRTKDDASYKKTLALFNALPEGPNKMHLRGFVNRHFGTYAGREHLHYITMFFDAEKEKMDPVQRMRALPGFVHQYLRFHGDFEKAKAYIAEILTVKNPNDAKDPKQAKAFERFEKERINRLNNAVCNVLEYKPELGEQVLAEHQKSFDNDHMGNIYLAFCKAAVAEKDRALFDRMLGKIKALPQSDARQARIRDAAAAVNRTPILKQKILDDLLKEDLTPTQRAQALYSKVAFPGYFCYGFNHEVGPYEEAKRLTQEVFRIAAENELERSTAWIIDRLRNDALVCSYDFGDFVWFRQLLADAAAVDKANADNRAENLLKRAADSRKRVADRIAQRKEREAGQLKRLNDDLEKALAKVKEADQTAKLKADAAKKIADLKERHAKAAVNDKRDMEQAEKDALSLEADAASARMEYATRWQFLTLDLVLQKKDKDAAKILGDALRIKRNAKNRDMRCLKYFLEGGTFDGFDKAFADLKLTSEQKMSAIRTVGDFYFRTKRFEEARALNAQVMEKMFRPAETNKRYMVKYRKDAPQTADAWARTPDYRNWNALETRFTSYFGYDVNNDKLLLKDTDLPVLDDAYKTGIQILFDDQAVHVYARINHPEVEKVAQGLISGPGLEWLFMPGRNYAYHSMHFSKLPGTDDPHWVNWAGATKNYRLTYNHIKKDAVITAEGFAAHFTIPWIFVYDRLPSAENTWGIGLCVWGGKATRTLGGLVHELERTLKLDFEMTPEQRTALERNICIQAYARYRNVRNHSGEYIQRWNDHVLGDPDFYKNALEPLLNELDEAGKKLLAPAPDADIHAIYTKYAPQWAEINYIIDEKRAAYLSEGLFRK